MDERLIAAEEQGCVVSGVGESNEMIVGRWLVEYATVIA